MSKSWQLQSVDVKLSTISEQYQDNSQYLLFYYPSHSAAESTVLGNVPKMSCFANVLKH